MTDALDVPAITEAIRALPRQALGSSMGEAARLRIMTATPAHLSEQLISSITGYWINYAYSDDHRRPAGRRRGKVVLTLCQGMQQQGHDVSLISLRDVCNYPIPSGIDYQVVADRSRAPGAS